MQYIKKEARSNIIKLRRRKEEKGELRGINIIEVISVKKRGLKRRNIIKSVIVKKKEKFITNF